MGLIETVVGLQFRNNGSDMDKMCYEVDQSSLRKLELATGDTTNIISCDDRKLTIDYICMLFSQLLTHDCMKTGQSNRLPGLICKHCKASDESGVFFYKKVS